ncbi:TetR family transcriptional regulator [Paenibacillus macerans]|uniref:TetR family transcriptional regulator n=1 Tax=Paenibacillus macerans TaxID=44252 RepID=UPI003D3169C4
MSPKLTDNKKEQRSLQILHAAKRVFSEKGYGPVTLKDIIEETGMSRGWIYLYYQTKEDIFEALLDHLDAEHERFIEELTASSPSIWEVIQSIYAQFLAELRRSPPGGLMAAFYEYFLIGWRDETRRKLLLKRYEKGISEFADLLRTGVERGEFSPVMEIMDISRIAAAYQEGIMTHSIAVGVEKTNSEMQFKALLQYLKSMLLPGENSDLRDEFK